MTENITTIRDDDTVTFLKVDVKSSSGITYPREVIEEAIKKNRNFPIMVSLGIAENSKTPNLEKLIGLLENVTLTANGDVTGKLTKLKLPATELYDKLCDMALISVGNGTTTEDNVVTDFTFGYVVAVPSPLAAKFNSLDKTTSNESS